MTSPPDSGRPRFPWRAAFHRSSRPIFVVGGSRRLRYANPAWETLTGREFSKARGMRISARRSTSELGQALAPPPEAWAGRACTVRRPEPPAAGGPPWWDVQFLPLPSAEGKVPAVVGFLTVVGAKAKGSPHGSATLAELRRETADLFPLDLFDLPSAVSARLVSQIRLAMATMAPVWVVGGPGSGKETLARVIHHAGPTRERAFLGLDCAGVQPYLIEGLLFGKGGLAGYGHLGTIYLKDPAALPRDFQERFAALATLPRANVPRLICGANSAADELVRHGTLLPAFHTSLAVLELHVPALANRPDDFAKLVSRLLDGPGPANDAWPVLRAYDWPGNVRELAEVLRAASIQAPGAALTAEHLPRRLRDYRHAAEQPRTPPTPPPKLDAVLEAVEKRMIALALRDTGNSQTDAAERLGIFRARLWRRLSALGIPAPPQPPKPRKPTGDAT